MLREWWCFVVGPQSILFWTEKGHATKKRATHSEMERFSVLRFDWTDVSLFRICFAKSDIHLGWRFDLYSVALTKEARFKWFVYIFHECVFLFLSMGLLTKTTNYCFCSSLLLLYWLMTFCSVLSKNPILLHLRICRNNIRTLNSRSNTNTIAIADMFVDLVSNIIYTSTYTI